MDLRLYQSNTIEGARQKLRDGHRRFIIQAATGAGKTVIASHMISSIAKNHKRCLFLTDSIELTKQALRTFEGCGLSVGVMQGEHPQFYPARLVQVCTQQTLQHRCKNRKEWGEYNYQVDVIFVDECHLTYKARNMLADLYPNAIFIGLTATPFSKGLGNFYTGGFICTVPMQQLIDENFLCDYIPYCPENQLPNLDKVKKNAKGDYDETAASERYTDQLVGDVVRHWEQRGKGIPTIGFALKVTESKRWADAFCAAGYKFEHIDGYDTSDEGKQRRARILRQLADGEIDGVFSVAILTKGYDEPIVGCMIDVRPTRSRMTHWQMVGRVLRIFPGKDKAIILDHSGNFIRNGFPEEFDFNSFTLCDGTNGNKKDRASKDMVEPKRCGQCGGLKRPKQHECPHCGHAPKTRGGASESLSDIQHVDGELVAVKKKKNKAQDMTREQKQEWYSSLITIQQQRGYNKHYAYACYIDKFGTKPHGLRAEAGTVIKAAENYVRYKNIRYSKGKNKGAQQNAA